MSPNPCKVVILTHFHSITAELDLKDERLSDLLNDERRSAILLSEVRVARLTAPSRIIAQHASAVVNKQQIVVGFEPQPPPQSSKRFYSYVKKNEYPIFLTLDRMEVVGLIHVPDKRELEDLYYFLTLRRESFVPVTKAFVTFGEAEQYVINQQAIIVNINHINYFSKADHPEMLPLALTLAVEQTAV
jgi:hypothetical protein